MAESFYATQGVGIAEFRLEDNGGAQFFHKSALPGNPELGGKIALHSGDYLNGNVLYISHAPF
jgi:hypothetical protein